LSDTKPAADGVQAQAAVPNTAAPDGYAETADAIAAGEPGAHEPESHARSLDGEIAAMRARIKAGLAGVRGLLSTASNGDHRATVSALSGLTNLVHEMLGPDTPSDSLRGALADLAAGRTEDARTALTAARTVLASGKPGVDPAEREEIDGTIGGALLALERGDRAASAMLAQTALDMIGRAD